jgi:hypothetical protein
MARSVCNFPGVYKEGFCLEFYSNIGHSVPFWSIFSISYTYSGVIFTYVCILREITDPIVAYTDAYEYCIESYGIR